MKGIVLAGDSGERLFPLSKGIPKQLLPIYDQPMIYYPIETLVESGIKEILIITSPKYITNFVSALGDGSKFGAKLSFTTQVSPDGVAQALTIGEEFLAKEPVCLITGDCIIIGNDRAVKLRKAIRAAKNSAQATIFVFSDKDPAQYGVVKLDKDGKCETIEGSSRASGWYSIAGLYVFPKGASNYAKVIEKSERGRYEVTSLDQMYLKNNKLQVQVLADNFRWLDTNTIDNILLASNFIKEKNNIKKW